MESATPTNRSRQGRREWSVPLVPIMLDYLLQHPHLVRDEPIGGAHGWGSWEELTEKLSALNNSGEDLRDTSFWKTCWEVLMTRTLKKAREARGQTENTFGGVELSEVEQKVLEVIRTSDNLEGIKVAPDTLPGDQGCGSPCPAPSLAGPSSGMTSLPDEAGHGMTSGTTAPWTKAEMGREHLGPTSHSVDYTTQLRRGKRLRDRVRRSHGREGLQALRLKVLTAELKLKELKLAESKRRMAHKERMLALKEKLMEETLRRREVEVKHLDVLAAQDERIMLLKLKTKEDALQRKLQDE